MGNTDRLASLDIVRGLIVAVMALDHTRIFFSAAQFDPLDLSQTSVAWYAMRLVTHICAPGFFYIAGFGAALSEARGLSKLELARFLVTRGIWLIVLDLTVMGVAWSFSFTGWFWFGVLWGLGAAMVAMAALIYLPRLVLLGAAIAAMLLQDQWLALVQADAMPIWTLLGTGGVWEAPLAGPRIVLYPLAPWLALMALGYASTGLLVRDGRPRHGLICIAGAAMIALFVASRMLGFGGGMPAESERELMAFFSVEKYPPSLQFSLLTLGVLLVFFGAVALGERNGGAPAWLHPLRIYGRVPFFFYILHIFLIHGAALGLAALLGWPYAGYAFWTPPWPNLSPPDGYGLNEGGVTLAWLAVLLVLLPLCQWFSDVKDRHKAWWLRYL